MKECIVLNKVFAEHKWELGTYDGMVAYYCERCGAKKPPKKYVSVDLEDFQ